MSIPDKNYHYKPLKVMAFFLLPSQIKSIPVPHIYALDKTCLLADYLHQLILGGYLRITTIMKNMATIIQAFANDKQYEIELISTYIIPYFRLVVYGVLTTKFESSVGSLYLNSLHHINNSFFILLMKIIGI